MTLTHQNLELRTRFDATIPARVSAIDDAVKHGSGEDPSKMVKISVTRDERSGVLVTVRDSGNGFDPGATQDPGTEKGLTAPNGRGLFLIRQLMDKVEFAAGGTEIRMRKLAGCSRSSRPPDERAASSPR